MVSDLFSVHKKEIKKTFEKEIKKEAKREAKREVKKRRFDVEKLRGLARRRLSSRRLLRDEPRATIVLRGSL